MLRRSARHVGRPGINLDTGFGVIDVEAALRHPAPIPDPQEPNDDIDQVVPGPIVPAGRPLLVSAERPKGSVTARIDGTKDPHDVYRAVVPPGSTLVVRSTAPRSARLRIWDGTTTSVDGFGSDQPRHLLATARRDGGPVTLRFANPGPAEATAFIDLWMLDGLLAGRYTLDAELVTG